MFDVRNLTNFAYMERVLEKLASIPMSAATLASLYPEVSAGNQKVCNLEQKGELLRLKKGLYVVKPSEGMTVSTELIANHIYAPSYVSMSTALRYYGLIPETVYTVQSMTVKHSRTFDTPLGRFEYTCMDRNSFHIGVTIKKTQKYAFLIATPEKALCDLIANSSMVNLRYLKDVEAYLEEDIRFDMEEFFRLNETIFEEYALVGKKGISIRTLLKFIRNGK